MTYGTPGDKTCQYRAALVTASQAATGVPGLVDPRHDLLVRAGAPSLRQLKIFDDIVGVTRMTAQRSMATAGTNRSVELEMTATVLISVWRPGSETAAEDDLQDAADTRAYALFDAIAEYVRVTDTTLGGVVRWCLCTSHESTGATDREHVDKGRLCEISAVFTAPARISS